MKTRFMVNLNCLKSNARKHCLLASGFLIIFLAYKHPLQADTSLNHINTLSKASEKILSKIENPLEIELYTMDANIREQASNIISLFQQKNEKITFKTTSTALDTYQKSQFNLHGNDHLKFNYQGISTITNIDLEKCNESSFRKILYQFIHSRENWVVFLSGHGEQSPSKDEKRHLSLLTEQIKSSGFQVAPLNISTVDSVPSNTQLLVIADPKTALLPQEKIKLLNYLKEGKNLLWLTNPDSTPIPELATLLGIDWKPGTIQDPHAVQMGAPHAAVNIITEYPEHLVTQQLEMLTVFPWSSALNTTQSQALGWKVTPLLTTHPKTTLTKGLQTEQGPFTLGITLTKEKQRIAIIGNTHFLSNAGIQNYGNLAFIHNLFHWLNESDLLLDTAPPTPIDATFTQTHFSLSMIKYVFPYVFSSIFLLIGWGIKRIRYQKHGLL